MSGPAKANPGGMSGPVGTCLDLSGPVKEDKYLLFGLHIITSYTHLHGILTRYAHHKWLHSRRGVSRCSGVHHYLLANAEHSGCPGWWVGHPKRAIQPVMRLTSECTLA